MNALLSKIGIIMMTLSNFSNIASAANVDSNTLKIHFPKVKLSLDPLRMQDAYSMDLVLQLYRGLLRFTPEGEVVTDIAHSWKESEDHLHYTFKLRDAKFSDGSKITAKNVQMSFARIFYLMAGTGADLDYISGAKEFKKSGDLTKFGVHAISDSEVEFELSHPSALFLKHLAIVDCAILPLNNYRDDFKITVHSPFSGPYKLSSEINENGVALEKWRKDALDSPKPPKKIHVLLSNETPEALARENKTDSLDHDVIDPKSFEDFQSKGWKKTVTEVILESFIILNPSKISSDLRKFLFSKVNQSDLTQAIDLKELKPAYGLIPTGISGELLKQDVAPKIAQARIPQKAKLEFNYEKNNPIHERIVAYLKTVWTSPNLTIIYSPLSKTENLTKMFEKKCDACIGQKLLDYPDGYSVLSYFKSGYSENYFHVNDFKIDHAISNTLKVFDQNKRSDLYRDIQKEILKHHTTIPLFFGTRAAGLWSPKVKSVPSHPMGFHTLPFEMVEMK